MLDGDKSPAESADKSAHSKARRPPPHVVGYKGVQNIQAKLQIRVDTATGSQVKVIQTN